MDYLAVHKMQSNGITYNKIRSGVNEKIGFYYEMWQNGSEMITCVSIWDCCKQFLLDSSMNLLIYIAACARILQKYANVKSRQSKAVQCSQLNPCNKHRATITFNRWMSHCRCDRVWFACIYLVQNVNTLTLYSNAPHFIISVCL